MGASRFGQSRDEGPVWQLPLPRETGQRLLRHKRTASENLGLWLDRHLPRTPGGTLKGETLLEALEALCQPMLSSAVQAAALRQRESLRALVHTHSGVLVVGDYEVKGRLLMDHGRATVLEAGLSFEHSTGAPHIAGSALKGAARAWLRTALEGESVTLEALRALLTESPSRLEGADKPSPEGRLGCSEADLAVIRRPEAVLTDLFGTEPEAELHLAGVATLLSALPGRGSYRLSIDILNPHAPGYVQEGVLPGEWLSPIPVHFLTVVETLFSVQGAILPGRRQRLGCLGGGTEAPGWAELDAETRGGVGRVLAALLDASLEGALWEHGVGAKTAAGYGRLRRVALVEPLETTG